LADAAVSHVRLSLALLQVREDPQSFAADMAELRQLKR